MDAALRLLLQDEKLETLVTWCSKCKGPVKRKPTLKSSDTVIYTFLMNHQSLIPDEIRQKAAESLKNNKPELQVTIVKSEAPSGEDAALILWGAMLKARGFAIDNPANCTTLQLPW